MGYYVYAEVVSEQEEFKAEEKADSYGTLLVQTVLAVNQAVANGVTDITVDLFIYNDINTDPANVPFTEAGYDAFLNTLKGSLPADVTVTNSFEIYIGDKVGTTQEAAGAQATITGQTSSTRYVPVKESEKAQ